MLQESDRPNPNKRLYERGEYSDKQLSPQRQSALVASLLSKKNQSPLHLRQTLSETSPKCSFTTPNSSQTDITSVISTKKNKMPSKYYRSRPKTSDHWISSPKNKSRSAKISSIRESWIWKSKRDVVDYMKLGFKGRVARKIPYVIGWNVKISRAASVLWTDESQFNLFDSDGRVMVWRTPQEPFDRFPPLNTEESVSVLSHHPM